MAYGFEQQTVERTVIYEYLKISTSIIFAHFLYSVRKLIDPAKTRTPDDALSFGPRGRT